MPEGTYKSRTLMNEDFETTPCPVCASGDFTDFLKAPDRFNVADGDKYALVRCQNCSLIFLNPRPHPDSVTLYYENAEYQPFLSTQENLSAIGRLYVGIRAFALKKKRSFIEKYKRSGRLLDIGCGTGEFLHEMQSSGWRALGIEKDLSAARFAQEHHKLQVTTENLQNCRFEAHSFDVITMWHVLEHLYDPLATLTEIYRLLNHNGLLLIAVPNISSFDASFYKENWVALDPPRHLQHFTPGTMQYLCTKTKLDLELMKQMPLDVFFNVLMSEKLMIAKYNPSMLLLPFYACRSAYVATVSFANGILSGKSGSSLLYVIRKQIFSG